MRRLADEPPSVCSHCVAVFYTGLDGYSCYRIPSIIHTSRGTLLAFAERRATSCGDDGEDHALVLKRSVDGGSNWGPTIVVRQGEPPCDGCPAAISNPNPVEVALADGSMAVMRLPFASLEVACTQPPCCLLC